MSKIQKILEASIEFNELIKNSVTIPGLRGALYPNARPPVSTPHPSGAPTVRPGEMPHSSPKPSSKHISKTLQSPIDPALIPDSAPPTIPDSAPPTIPDSAPPSIVDPFSPTLLPDSPVSVAPDTVPDVTPVPDAPGTPITIAERLGAGTKSVIKSVKNIKLPDHITAKYPRGSKAFIGALKLGALGLTAYMLSGKKPVSDDSEKMDILKEAIKNNPVALPSNAEMADSLLVIKNLLKEKIEASPESDEYLKVYISNTELMSKMIKDISATSVNFDNPEEVIKFKEKLVKFKTNLKKYLEILKKSQQLTLDADILDRMSDAEQILSKYDSFLDKYAPV
jgi:hypothetical protein